MKRGISFRGLIEPPPRSSAAGTALVLLVVAALSWTAAMPSAAGKWTLTALVVLMLPAVLFRAVYAVHIALFALAWTLPADFGPSLQHWPLGKLVPLAAYGLAVFSVAPLRHSVGWLHPGRFDRKVRLPVLAVILVSGPALVAWVILRKPDLQHHLESIPPMPLWVFPLAAIGFASANAALEEMIFRGIMMEALDSAIGAGFWSIAAQAVAFAAFHYRSGFPNGVAGFLMVLAYGFMLGTVRRRSSGMLAPWAAHVAADMVIFVLLALIHLQGSR